MSGDSVMQGLIFTSTRRSCYLPTQTTIMCIFVSLSYKLTQKNTLKKKRRYFTQQLTSEVSLGIVTWYGIYKNSIQRWRKISNISDVRRNSRRLSRWLKIDPTGNQSLLGDFYSSARQMWRHHARKTLDQCGNIESWLLSKLLCIIHKVRLDDQIIFLWCPNITEI